MSGIGANAALRVSTSGGNDYATISGTSGSETFIFSGTSTYTNNALYILSAGGVVDLDYNSNPTSLIISSGTTSSGLTVSAAVTLTVQSGGTASATIVDNDGSEYRQRHRCLGDHFSGRHGDRFRWRVCDRRPNLWLRDRQRRRCLQRNRAERRLARYRQRRHGDQYCAERRRHGRIGVADSQSRRFADFLGRRQHARHRFDRQQRRWRAGGDFRILDRRPDRDLRPWHQRNAVLCDQWRQRGRNRQRRWQHRDAHIFGHVDLYQQHSVGCVIGRRRRFGI